MSKRHPVLKASSIVLILCGVIILACLSLYHSVPFIRSNGRTTTTTKFDVVHNNSNESWKEEKEPTETPAPLTTDNSTLSLSTSIARVDSPISLLPMTNDSSSNNKISDSLSSNVVTQITTHNSNLTSANESTATPVLPLPRQSDNNETKGSDDVVIDPAFLKSRRSSSFFVNYIMNSRPHANCHRTCVDFRNKIYFSKNVWDPGAGIKDRLTIIATLLNMAGYLCARLYIPRPKFLLRAEHNNNKKLAATNITWSEFGTFVLWNDPEQENAVVDWDNPNDKEEWPLLESSRDEPADLFQFAKIPQHVKDQFPLLEQYTFAQQRQQQQQQQRLESVTNHNNNQTNSNSSNQTNRFIWHIGADYFHWEAGFANYLQNRSLPEHYQQNELEKRKEPFIFAHGNFYLGCQYAKVEPTRHMQELQEKIVAKILRPQNTSSVQPPTVGYFHVRRQDAKSDCNTNLTKIKDFLTCSLGEAILQLSTVPSSSNTSSRDVIILFSSDEVDQEYRQEVLQLIEEQHFQAHNNNKVDNHPVNVTAVDFDHLVKETIRTDVENGRIPSWRQNNFYTFLTVFGIGYNQRVVHFHMEQHRRANCKPCVNVTDQLRQAGLLLLNV